MSGVYYHIVAFACEKDTSARLAPALSLSRLMIGCRGICATVAKPPTLPPRVREPSHGYSQWARYVKRLLLDALARKTNRGREAHKERE